MTIINYIECGLVLTTDDSIVDNPKKFWSLLKRVQDFEVASCCLPHLDFSIPNPIFKILWNNIPFAEQEELKLLTDNELRVKRKAALASLNEWLQKLWSITIKEDSYVYGETFTLLFPHMQHDAISGISPKGFCRQLQIIQDSAVTPSSSSLGIATIDYPSLRLVINPYQRGVNALHVEKISELILHETITKVSLNSVTIGGEMIRAVEDQPFTEIRPQT